MQCGGMHGAFGEPELVPHDPGEIVSFAGEALAAYRAAVLVRLVRVELERHAVARAAPSVAREECLLRGDVEAALEERLKVAEERGGERGQWPPDRGTAALQRVR